jgi:hypothetical protein
MNEIVVREQLYNTLTGKQLRDDFDRLTQIEAILIARTPDKDVIAGLRLQVDIIFRRLAKVLPDAQKLDLSVSGSMDLNHGVQRTRGELESFLLSHNITMVDGECIEVEDDLDPLS